jgi:Secretion system C-terminal sorting domain
MKKICITVMALGMYGLALAQLPTQDPYPNAPAAPTNINQYLLYVDSVRTINQQVQSFAAAANNTIGSLSVSLSGTISGMHQLYVQVIDVAGKPSIMNIGNFYMEGNNLYQNVPAAATNINKYSFYIDSVRNVNEQVQNFTASNTNASPSQSISLAGVNSGMHQLYAKVTDVTGKPSIINIGNFYMEGDNRYQNAPIAANNINRYDFYIDSVRSTNEQTLNFTAAATNSTPAQTISLAGTISGVHQLYAKVTDVTGKPSIMNLGNFYMEGDNRYQNAPAVAANINRYEFYIDSITNVNIQPLIFTAGATNATASTSINLAGVIPGVHYLYARVFDVNNKESIVNLGQFVMDQVFRYPNVAAAAPALQNMEYFVDTDPGYGLATAIAIPGTNTTEVLNNISISISNTLSAGTHYLHIRSKQNPWSIDNVVPFAVQSVVPVSWLYVKAQLVNKQSLVTWGTAQEADTKSFEIEHSIDGRIFSKIGEVAAAGNSSTAKNYLHNHASPVSGFNYYRIKQIDNSGSFKYSAIVTILKKENLTSVIVAPNPVKDMLHVVEPSNAFIVSAEVYSLEGKRMLQKNINADAQVFSIPVNNLPAAQYILKLNYKTESKSYRFVKE